MKFLVGVDLGVSGHEWVVDRAARYATIAGARLDLVYAVTPEARVGGTHGFRSRLLELMQRMPEENRGVPRLVDGAVIDVLVQEAHGCDLLICGPREPGAVEAFFMGTIATRLIRRAPVPVLIPRSDPPPVDRPLKLLVGVDLRAGDPVWLVGQGRRWAESFGGTLDGVYVDPHRLPYIRYERVRTAAEKELQAIYEADRKKVADLLATLPEANRGTAHVGEGEPEAGLVAMSDGYDLLLVGNLERKGLATYLLGSVADHVVRHARCDVMTLPASLHVAGEE